MRNVTGVASSDKLNQSINADLSIINWTEAYSRLYLYPVQEPSVITVLYCTKLHNQCHPVLLLPSRHDYMLLLRSF